MSLHNRRLQKKNKGARWVYAAPVSWRIRHQKTCCRKKKENLVTLSQWFQFSIQQRNDDGCLHGCHDAQADKSCLSSKRTSGIKIPSLGSKEPSFLALFLANFAVFRILRYQNAGLQTGAHIPASLATVQKCTPRFKQLQGSILSMG
ncbi:hypothetical protein J3459_010556 [Metarhizium acridum]|nr:hypothetical protein J3459_010556 [Metarhizium acridum]